MHLKKFLWPVIGLIAVLFSAWLLYHELRGLSLDELWESLANISATNWVLCVLSTLAAYAALAGYDRLALKHLRRSNVGWLYLTITSFTTYALSHNIGASVFSGSVVRYRAYTAKGISASEVGILVAFCSFTFTLGVMILGGLVFLIEPEVVERFVDMLPLEASWMTGGLLLLLVGLYLAGSLLRMRSLHIGKIEISYPRPSIAFQQLLIGPLEIVGAAAIIYFALPEAGNPGFLVVLGIFVISFSLALLSHAPGGLGVLELAFITGLNEMSQADVLAALLVFRLFYLIIPLFIALFVVLGFERSQLYNPPTSSST